MTQFLTASACHGHKPRLLNASPCYPRNDLLAKMIRQRRFVRFIVAPTLFGKTSLISEYAQSVFSFNEVFWIDGKSPYFIRDLDRGVIVSDLLQDHPLPALIIFDDIPVFDEVRADEASKMFSEFITQGWEVVVATVPQGNVFAQRQKSALYLDSSDLLLSDSEMREEEQKREESHQNFSSLSQKERIPCLFWGNEEDFRRLLCYAGKEELPTAALLMVFVMVVLGKGSFADIRIFLSDDDDASFALLSQYYLYLGMDIHQEKFATCFFSEEVITEAFLPFLSHMACSSSFEEGNTLVMRLADVLIGRGNPDRACALVRMLCMPKQRASWLEARGKSLFEKGCFFEAHEMYRSFSGGQREAKNSLEVAEAWRLFILGDSKKAHMKALKLCRSFDSTETVRAYAGLLLIREEEESSLEYAYALLKGIIRFSSSSLEGWCNQEVLTPFSDKTFSWEILTVGALCLRQTPLRFFEFLEACYKAHISDTTLAVLLLEALQKMQQKVVEVESPAGGNQEESEECYREKLFSQFLSFIERCRYKQHLDFYEARLFIEIEKQTDFCLSEVLKEAYPSIFSSVHAHKASLCKQRENFKESGRFLGAQQKDQVAPSVFSPLNTRGGFQKEVPAPLLSVHLFGGLEVAQGGKSVDPKLFSRQKVKTLLALLVINQGKELSRDKVSHLLWPESNSSSAQRNLYSIWSLLKKALKTPSGKCPYLIRTQFSCKIDTALVSSDIAEFNDLCRKLLFGSPHAGEWVHVFKRLNDLYAGELLPTETQNSAIVKARDDYQQQFVNALAMAAVRLHEMKDYQLALWFAHAAVSRDPTREDAYTVLMQAQIALGQRTAALDTYFRCRRYLSEELGIDPSLKTQYLYNQVIAEETIGDKRTAKLF